MQGAMKQRDVIFLLQQLGDFFVSRVVAADGGASPEIFVYKR